MPFVTEYNTSLVFKKLIGEIPDDIRNWQPLFILLDIDGNEISKIGYTIDINEFRDFVKQTKK